MARRKKTRGDKNFFSFFILLGLGFLALVLANRYLSYETSVRTKATGPRCYIEVPDKYNVTYKDKSGRVVRTSKANPVIWNDGGKDKPEGEKDFFAVERGKEIGFRTVCTGVEGEPLSYWNFGDGSCERWQRVAKSVGSGAWQLVYENRHTFRENGDYFVGFKLKEGDEVYYIRVGVYDKKKVSGEIEQAVPDNDSDPEVNIVNKRAVDLVGILGVKLAGYMERMCLFSRREETRGIGYREVIPIGEGESFVGYRFYFDEVDPGKESNFCNALHETKFWDFPWRDIRGKVDGLRYVLKGGQGEGSNSELRIDMMEVVYRQEGDYREGPVCIPEM